MAAPIRLVLALLLAAAVAGCASSVPSRGPATSSAAATASQLPAPVTADPSTAPAPAPSSAPTAPPAGRAPVVVLDPGHNGGNSTNPAAINRPVPGGRGKTKPCNTTGTQSNGGYPEHAFTWDLSLRVRDKLAARGITVVMTRDDDSGVGPCVDVRGAAAERAGADATVSLHADGSAPGNRGFHVAYSEPPLNSAQSGSAHVLAADLRDALRDGGFQVSDYIGRDGLSARADLAGLNIATRPAALIECANMRNAADAAVLASPGGRERYATAIAVGIARFVGR